MIDDQETMAASEESLGEVWNCTAKDEAWGHLFTMPDGNSPWDHLFEVRQEAINDTARVIPFPRRSVG